MNKALCSLQMLWGVLFSVTSLGKIPCYRFLGGVGLILSATTAVKPKLTPLAATGLTLVVILAAIFHIGRGEYNFLPVNPGLGGVAAFIAYGRLSVKPIAPASINPPA